MSNSINRRCGCRDANGKQLGASSAARQGVSDLLCKQWST
jgi:hypothetical protein